MHIIIGHKFVVIVDNINEHIHWHEKIRMPVFFIDIRYKMPVI